jgi:hypothetical protein
MPLKRLDGAEEQVKQPARVVSPRRAVPQTRLHRRSPDLKLWLLLKIRPNPQRRTSLKLPPVRFRPMHSRRLHRFRSRQGHLKAQMRRRRLSSSPRES